MTENTYKGGPTRQSAGKSRRNANWQHVPGLSADLVLLHRATTAQGAEWRKWRTPARAHIGRSYHDPEVEHVNVLFFKLNHEFELTVQVITPRRLFRLYSLTQKFFLSVNGSFVCNLYLYI